MKLKIGDKAEITQNTSSHEFKIGAIVNILELYPDGTPPHYRAESDGEVWYVNDVDLKQITHDNTKLREAAPDLLEALQMIISSANPQDVTPHKMAKGIDLGEYYVGGCGIPSNEAIHKAVAAIKKAIE